MDKKISLIAKEFHAAHLGNCAMAVAYAFTLIKTGSTEEAQHEAGAFKNSGAGRAEGGTCGALYAAKKMLPAKANEIEKYFAERAQGCTLCNEIRPNGVIPCNRCVELAGEALDAFKC